MKECLRIPRKSELALKLTRGFHDFIIKSIYICCASDSNMFRKQSTKNLIMKVKDEWDSKNTYDIQFDDVDDIDIRIKHCEEPELSQWIYKIEIIQEKSLVRITLCDSLLDENNCSVIIIKAKSIKINHTSSS